MLEGFDLGARLARGRAYARGGQVTALAIGEGIVEAKVQGSRARPYDVTIRMNTLSRTDWRRLAVTLGGQALRVARLLAGKMPADIEEAFKAAGLTLFPARKSDLATECSCPDWSNPCKHIAAVYYLLGEEFDRDPFLIFKLRGMSREALIDLLGAQEEGQRRVGRNRQPHGREAPAAQPLSAEPGTFWGHGRDASAMTLDMQPPAVAAAIVRRLGRFPFWRGERDFLMEMEETYRWASAAGAALLLGEPPPETTAKPPLRKRSRP